MYEEFEPIPRYVYACRRASILAREITAYFDEAALPPLEVVDELRDRIQEVEKYMPQEEKFWSSDD